MLKITGFGMKSVYVTFPQISACSSASHATALPVRCLQFCMQLLQLCCPLYTMQCPHPLILTSWVITQV